MKWSDFGKIETSMEIYWIVLLSFFLGSGIFQVQRYVSTGVCSWAGISECLCFFLVIICISDILFLSFWQDTRFDFGSSSMSINDEWIIREFLHFLIMEVCAFMPVILLSHLPISVWVVSAFLYVSPWFFMCPSSDRDFIKGMRTAKLFHTLCYVLCFIGLSWAW